MEQKNLGGSDSMMLSQEAFGFFVFLFFFGSTMCETTPYETSVAGFDPGRKYLAWAVVKGSQQGGWKLHRHGLMYPPDIGGTRVFAKNLRYWSYLFDVFMEYDLKVGAFGIERFVYTPGGRGSGSEDINLRIAHMNRVGGSYIRNVEWKRWFSRNVCVDGTHSYFGTPTPHEADAAGIALYTACSLTK